MYGCDRIVVVEVEFYVQYLKNSKDANQQHT